MGDTDLRRGFGYPRVPIRPMRTHHHSPGRGGRPCGASTWRSCSGDETGPRSSASGGRDARVNRLQCEHRSDRKGRCRSRPGAPIACGRACGRSCSAGNLERSRPSGAAYLSAHPPSRSRPIRRDGSRFGSSRQIESDFGVFWGGNFGERFVPLKRRITQPWPSAGCSACTCEPCAAGTLVAPGNRSRGT